MFCCNICKSSFDYERDLNIHLTIDHKLPPSNICKICGKCFGTISSQYTHEQYCSKFKRSSQKMSKLGKRTFADVYHSFIQEHDVSENKNLNTDPSCSSSSALEENLSPPINKKAKNCFSSEPSKKDLLNLFSFLDDKDENVVSYKTAFENRIVSFYMRSSKEKKIMDLKSFIEHLRSKIKKILNNYLNSFKSIKVNFVVETQFINVSGEMCDRAFKTKNKGLYNWNNLDEYIDSVIDKLTTEFEESQLKKSGWSLNNIDGLRLKINKFSPLSASRGCCIILPNSISVKKCCINVNNNDNKCFMYAILAKFVSKNPQKVSKYGNLIGKYDFSCLNYPVQLKDITRFERINKISINVYALDENNNTEVYPLKVAKQILPDHRDLLIVKGKDKQNHGNHYVYIKSLSRLISKQINKRGKKIIICKRCFLKFDNRKGDGETQLENHTFLCNTNSPARIVLPTDEPYVRFKNPERGSKVKFVIYGDFETILTPILGNRPSPNVSWTVAYQKHNLMSYGLIVKTDCPIIEDENDEPSLHFNKVYIYRGQDVGSHFIKTLESLASKILKYYKKHLVRHTSTENVIINNSSNSNCLLKKQKQNLFVPVFFHNLSSYDAHFIIRLLGETPGDITVIPNTQEKYISFTKNILGLKFRFIDSYRFIDRSLAVMASNLPDSKFTTISQHFSPSLINLVKRKGVFPYEFVDDWDKLNEKCLPNKEAFYSQLTGTNITDDEYDHAQRVWKQFQCLTLGDYSDLYLKIDVLLLCDCFEAFRDITLSNYSIDPAHFFTTPGMAWDIMLKFTGIRLQLLTDYDQILFIERGIRGGLCQVSKKFVQANNEYMKVTNYDSDKPSSFIEYLDANGLYATAMSMPLPYDNIEWLSRPETMNHDTIINLSETDDIGYILEVDLTYPKNQHDAHRDLPFLPEVITPPTTHLANKKLIPHLGDRKRYVVHYLALKQALENGIKIEKVHRVLKFHQSKWLEKYISFNTNLRREAKNPFEKDFYKLMCNAVFGKTMENIRNRINITLVSDKNKLNKLVAKPNFLDSTIINENLVAVHMSQTKLFFNKPIYVGMSILDISKTFIYDFHYNVMLKKYNKNLQLLYTDTDSLIYHIKTVDFYKDMKNMLHYFDTSNYPKNHECYSETNKSKLGVFKDECSGQIITEFIALRPKMYSLKYEDEKSSSLNEIKRAKGVSKSSLNKFINHEAYKNILFCNQIIPDNNDDDRDTSVLRVPMNMIRSKNHLVSSIQINKKALSSNDDKRVFLPDLITSLPYYHYSIQA